MEQSVLVLIGFGPSGIQHSYNSLRAFQKFSTLLTRPAAVEGDAGLPGKVNIVGVATS
jgi:hypothetical protein